MTARAILMRLPPALCLGAATTIAVAWFMPTAIHAWRRPIRDGLAWFASAEHERRVLQGPNRSEYLWITSQPLSVSALIRSPAENPPLSECYTDPPDDDFLAGFSSALPPRPPPRWAVRLDKSADASAVSTTAFGWPARALAHELWVFPHPGGDNPAGFVPSPRLTSAWAPIKALGPLPLRILWQGFTLDTLLFSAAWWPAFLLPSGRPRWWREGRRLRRGQCPACGHDLRWNLKAGCAVCGWHPA